jgi:hypothetical protein
MSLLLIAFGTVIGWIGTAASQRVMDILIPGIPRNSLLDRSTRWFRWFILVPRGGRKPSNLSSGSLTSVSNLIELDTSALIHVDTRFLYLLMRQAFSFFPKNSASHVTGSVRRSVRKRRAHAAVLASSLDCTFCRSGEGGAKGFCFMVDLEKVGPLFGCLDMVPPATHPVYLRLSNRASIPRAVHSRDLVSETRLT